MKFITKEVRIGIAGIVSLFILVYGINYLKGINLFRPTSYFFVKFDNIAQLTTSSPVYADGVKVGIVRDIMLTYSHPGDVVVEIEVDPQMRIPKGTTAELVPQLMGEVQMRLLLANNPREKYLPGDTIIGGINEGIFDQAAKMMPQLITLIPKIDSVLISLNNILSNQSIPSTLNSLEKTMANLEVTTNDLKGFMKKDIPELTNKLNNIGDNFLSVSEQLIDVDYVNIAKQIDVTLANVKTVTEKLNDNDNTIGLLLNDPNLYNNLNETAINASNLLLDLKEHPKRYVQFSLFGRKEKKSSN